MQNIFVEIYYISKDLTCLILLPVGISYNQSYIFRSLYSALTDHTVWKLQQRQ